MTVPTTDAAGSGSGSGPSILTPDVRTVARRARGPLVAAAVLVVVGLLALVGGDRGTGLLDTRSASKAGSKAIAELLRDHDVAVRQVRTVDAAAATAGGTLVVAQPDLLPLESARRIANSDASTVVLVGSSNPDVLAAFTGAATIAGVADPEVKAPACALPAALAAGRASAGGVLYDSPVAAGCYPTEGHPSLLVVDDSAHRVVLLGAASVLRNDHLGKEGNAALALNLLGAESELTWYLPSLQDLYGHEDLPPKSLLDLAPRGVIWALGWLCVVVLLLAAWRVRRLGAVVPEPLPVIVRASETVEGRARLYRRSRARARAADLLRAASRDRLGPRLGVATGSAPAVLVSAVAQRTGRAPAEIGALLYGAAPSDDATLVRLADELDRIEREVHRT